MAEQNNPFSKFFENGQGLEGYLAAGGSLAGTENWNQKMYDAMLSGMPQATYMSDPGGQAFAAQSPRQGRYFQNAYQDIYGQYLGNLGTSLREGKPWANFRYFLGNDPWTKKYSQLPQYERGVTKTYTDPRTRFIFY